MPRFVVLLRGVNVGKHNRVPMADFRDLLEGLGFTAVRTVLNSGNAVVDAAGGTADEHAEMVTAALLRRLGVSVPVVVKTSEAWTRIVGGNPMPPPELEFARFLVAFGRTAEDVRSLAPLEAQGRDRLEVTDEAGYLHCPDGILASPLAAAALGRTGRRVTTRNWATVRKIDELVREGGHAG